MHTALQKLIRLQLQHWDAKYDWTMVESRLVCCLTSMTTNDMDYWINDTITKLFCEIADAFVGMVPEEEEEDNNGQ